MTKDVVKGYRMYIGDSNNNIFIEYHKRRRATKIEKNSEVLALD